VKYLIIKLIDLYQKTLSPDTGWLRNRFPNGYCKYTPHCSEYCKEAVIKKGVLMGVILGLWRALRCNPWSKGGWDPL